MSRKLILLTLLAVAAFSSPDAGGFCRRTTCKTCPRDAVTGCPVGGQPLVWPARCVSYTLTRQAPRAVSLAVATEITAAAFHTWQSVVCPGTGAPPSIVLSDAFGPSGCNLADYSDNGPNANEILFRDVVWPYPEAEDAMGLTSVSFDTVTGQILDADIEVNATLPLSTTDELVPDHDDLQSILTHEAGHFLGLAHSLDPGSVMRASYGGGVESLRVPNEDDIAGICAIYPPDRRALPCDFTPHGGFAAECPLGIWRGGCAIGPPVPSARDGWTLLGFWSGILLPWARRRRAAFRRSWRESRTRA